MIDSPTSLFRGLIWAGVALIAMAALAAQSLVSIPHLAGAGLALVGLAGLAWRGQLASALRWPSRRWLWGLLALVAIGHALLIWASYESMSYPYSDTGYAAERIANLVERGTFDIHTLGRDGLADHFCPVLAGFAPLWALWPTFLWFPIAKVIAFLLAALLLARLGREVLGPGSKAVWALPVLWLVHGVVGYAVVFDFQSDHLTPPLIIGAFLAATKERWWIAFGCLLVLAGLKENMPLVWICVGLWLALERGRRRLGLGLAAAGVLVGILVFFVAMPAFGDSMQVHEGRFGPSAMLPEKAFVVAVCFLSLGALPLARPRTLLWSLPIFGLHFVSRFANMFSFRHHYFLSVMAVLFVAALYGLRDLRDGKVLTSLAPRRRDLVLALGAAALIGLNGWLPFYPARLRWPTPQSMETKDALLAVRAELPEDVDVWTGLGEGLYLLPTARLRVSANWPKLPEPHAPHVVVVSRWGTPWYDRAAADAVLATLDAEVAAGRSARIIDNDDIVAYRRTF